MHLTEIYTVFSHLPLECMQARFMQEATLALLLLTPLTAILGIVVVNSRMAFFTDAIGHSVFTGLALGYMLDIPYRPAMITFSIMAGYLIIFVSKKEKMSEDTATGIIFSAIIALGLLLSSRSPGAGRAEQFLYGDILAIGEGDIYFLGIFFIIGIIYIFFAYNSLMSMALNARLARIQGCPTPFWEYSFATLLSSVVIVAVWGVGILMVTALLIVPASAARNLSSSAAGMFWWSIIISMFSGMAGLILSAQAWLAASTGPTIVMMTCMCFLASALWRRLRS